MLAVEGVGEGGSPKPWDEAKVPGTVNTIDFFSGCQAEGEIYAKAASRAVLKNIDEDATPRSDELEVESQMVGVRRTPGTLFRGSC